MIHVPLALLGAGLVAIGLFMGDDRSGSAPETESFPAEGGTGDDVTAAIDPGSADADPVGRWATIAYDAAQSYQVPAGLLLGMIKVESGGNPTARAGSTSARGLMQMTKAACSDVGVDWNALDDPTTAINAGAAYLARLAAQFDGDFDKAVMAYNQGAGAVRKGNPTVIAEATRYLEHVKSAETAYG